jgi:predicted dehydrogenase
LAISADIGIQRPGATADDYFHVVLRYPTLRVILHGNLLTAAVGPRFSVHGTQGSFVKHGLDVQEGQLKAGMTPGAPGWGVDGRYGTITRVVDEVPVTQEVPIAPSDYRQFYAGVRAAIADGAPSPVPVEGALRTMELLELAARAAEERREIAL